MENSLNIKEYTFKLCSDLNTKDKQIKAGSTAAKRFINRKQRSEQTPLVCLFACRRLESQRNMQSGFQIRKVILISQLTGTKCNQRITYILFFCYANLLYCTKGVFLQLMFTSQHLIASQIHRKCLNTGFNERCLHCILNHQNNCAST